MTHRTVEGSLDGQQPNEQDAPASPAQPQGEREAFEEMRLTLIGQVHELLDIAERHCWTDDEEEKRRTQGAIDYARKVTAPYNYNGGRASLSASTPSAEARDAARLVSDLSLLVNRMAHRLSRRAGGEGTEAGDREMARQASVFLRRKNLATPLRDDAAMAPPAGNKENGNA